jgi:anti-sigma B factor antagonist
MKKKLEFSANRRDDLTWIYTVSGHLYGLNNGYTFQDDVRERVSAGARKVVVDLSEVERIDSSGIGILASLMFSASQAGGGLVLAALPKRIEQLLSMAMLLDHIDHADSVDEALAKLDAMDLETAN